MPCVRIELLRATFLLISVGFSGGIEDKLSAESWSTVSEDRTAVSYDGLVASASSAGPPTVSTRGPQRIGSEKRVCQGTVSGLGHADDQNERYQLYRSLYTECTHVDGNLEIVFLGNHSLDLSFLQTIREISGYVLIVANYLSYIPLSNLRIIRGCNLFEYEGRRFSLYVALNYDRLRPDVGLKELRFTSLHEIMAGSVFIYDNPHLCFHDTIVWEDILSGEGANFFFDRSSELEKLNVSTTCGKCHRSCQSGCWGSGPEYCQELTRVSCSPQCDGHCFGRLPNQCCDPECAGGCSGPNTSQCWSCKNFDNGGVCVSVCPPLEIYSPHEFRMVPNQEFKYAYGSLCVDKCPAHLIADKVSCVHDCGSGKMAGKDGRCLECDGPCPKTCRINMENSEFINSKNIAEFAGCTIIQGSIKILDATFAEDKYFGTVALKPHQLSALESIQEVTDFVQIQANQPHFRNLNFLKNLRIIHGRKLDRLRTRTSLQIFKTSLESLGLESLEEIRFGHVHISNNSRLCYASAINWTRIRAKSEQKPVVEFNRDATSCAQDSEVCASECTDDGCWGPFDTQCVSCRNFHLGNRCVKDCASTPEIFQSRDKECQICDMQCMTGCYGPGPGRCDGCRNVKDGPYCVDRCPETKYADEGAICQPCHPNCESGCTGPKNAVVLGGCNSCSLVVYSDNKQNVTECLRVNSPCPDGYYRQKIINDTNFRSLEGKQACTRCHSQCTTCIGYGPAFCLSCRHYRQEEECVSKCRAGYFVDQESNECLRCDPQCLGCHGPTANDCAKCKLYKLYLDSKSGVDMMFNCTDTCPDFAPYKHLDEASKEMMCIAENNRAIHQQWMFIGITLVVVGIMMALLVVSLILCNQRNKAWKSAQKLMESMHQSYEAEPLKPTNAKPDMAKMRIVSESDLQWGSYILGSGAFGTVFKGVWTPAHDSRVKVAVKVLQKSSGEQSKEFLDEARIMCSVDHPCCVRILGICLSARMMLVTQLMPLGCLLEFIRRNADRVGSAMLLNWCRQIAEGMNHLESRGIVHCDLAARNVLVESAEQVKITDFGLAKMLELGHKEFQAERGKMPIKWLALESITTRIFTHKSDVWSFGVTLWEIFTFGKRPYENVPVREIPVLLEKGERLLQPNACSIELYMLMTKCWMSDADKRPKFEVLVNALSEMAVTPLQYLRIDSDDHVHSSEPVSWSSDDYDTRFEQYIEPVRKGSNVSVRYIQQPGVNGGWDAQMWKNSFEEDRVVSGKSKLWSSRISDCVRSLDSIEEYEVMSPVSRTSNGSVQTSDDLPQYINIVDALSDSEENSDADDCSSGTMDPDPLLLMLKDRAIANPEYFDAFVNSPVKSVLRRPGQINSHMVHHRPRVDSLGFTEESSRSSTEGSEHDYYNFL